MLRTHFLTLGLRQAWRRQPSRQPRAGPGPLLSTCCVPRTSQAAIRRTQGPSGLWSCGSPGAWGRAPERGGAGRAALSWLGVASAWSRPRRCEEAGPPRLQLAPPTQACPAV